jgi:hypothetical protein
MSAKVTATAALLTAGAAVVLFEFARRKVEAWELERAQKLVERENARTEARKAAAARLKRALFLGSFAVVLTTGAVLFVRSSVKGSQRDQAVLRPAIAY